MIIDTNVYSALNRGDATVREVLRGTTSLSLPIVVAGELYYGFTNGNNQEVNEVQLEKFLAKDVVELIPLTARTSKIYGEFSTYCRRKGRVLAHNDIWTAALAHEHGERFVTFDKDFAVFADIFGDKLLIL